MLRRLSTGTFTLEIEETNIQKLQMALDKASDKLMIGLVVASLVVGSSLVLLSHPLSSSGLYLLGCDLRLYLCRARWFLCDISCYFPEVPYGTVITGICYWIRGGVRMILQALTFSGREIRAFAGLVDGRITTGTCVDMFIW